MQNGIFYNIISTERNLAWGYALLKNNNFMANKKIQAKYQKILTNSFSERYCQKFAKHQWIPENVYF